MGCAYAKNKMESEYHIHIGKTGESDVLVSFIDEYGDNLSTITIGEEDQDTAEETDPAMNLEDYVGLWEYQGENRWLRIHDDSTWEFVND